MGKNGKTNGKEPEPGKAMPLQYRGFLVSVWFYGRDWCARAESIDGLTVRSVADAPEPWRALDRALNIIDNLSRENTTQ